MYKVGLVNCKDYDINNVREAMSSLILKLGGVGKFARKGQKVLIKANLLNNFKLETQTTTNPFAVEALTEILIEHGCEVVIGDSSGGLYNGVHMNSVYKACGMTGVAERTGAKLNDDFGFSSVRNDKGVVFKEFDIIDVAKNADVIINFAKLKTHSLTFYTGCVKNLFGTIPGLQKVQIHSQFPTLISFMDCLIDISEFFADKISLNIIDAVWGMEGPGPSAGTPKFLGKFIGGESALACDLVGMTLMGGDIQEFPQVAVSKRRGLSPTTLEEIEIVGEDLQSSIVKDFRRLDNDRQWEVQHLLPVIQKKRASRLFAPYPWVSKKLCKGCKKCFEHCPNQAIVMRKGKATFELEKCIRCYCCQELCPFHLIKIKKSLVYKIMRRL